MPVNVRHARPGDSLTLPDGATVVVARATHDPDTRTVALVGTDGTTFTVADRSPVRLDRRLTLGEWDAWAAAIAGGADAGPGWLAATGAAA